MAARKLGIVRHSLRPALSLLSPQPMAAQAFTEATAAPAASRKSTSATRTSYAITLRLGR